MSIVYPNFRTPWTAACHSLLLLLEALWPTHLFLRAATLTIRFWRRSSWCTVLILSFTTLISLKQIIWNWEQYNLSPLDFVIEETEILDHNAKVVILGWFSSRGMAPGVQWSLSSCSLLPIASLSSGSRRSAARERMTRGPARTSRWRLTTRRACWPIAG